jgi:hypothetical protein
MLRNDWGFAGYITSDSDSVQCIWADVRCSLTLCYRRMCVSRLWQTVAQRTPFL